MRAQPWWVAGATGYTLSNLLIGASPIGFNPAAAFETPSGTPYFYFQGALDEVRPFPR